MCLCARIMGCGGSKPKAQKGKKKKGGGGASQKSKTSTKRPSATGGDGGGGGVMASAPARFGTSGGGGGGGVGFGSSSATDDFRSRLASAGTSQLLIIRFYRGDCPSCLSVGQFYQGLTARYPQVIFLDANLVRNTRVLADMRIESVPTFIAFKDHHELERYVGTDTQQVEALVTRNL